TWNHLWYLAYLLPYTLLLLLAMPVLRRAASGLAAMSRWRPLAGAVLCVAPVAWLAWVYLSLAPEYPRTHSLFGDWTVHAESLPLFLLGYLVAANGWFWDGVRRARWPTLALAVLGTTVELSLRWTGLHPLAAALPEWAVHLPWHDIERWARAAYTWFALLAIFGWSRAWLDRPFHWLPYCTEAVSSWDVLRQTRIIVAAYSLAPLRLGPVLGPLLVVGGTVAGCLVLHEFMVRRSALLRPLFGLKPGRPALPAMQAMPARAAES